ncbi:MAG: hypothetical protein GYB67_10515, partial [Chloroflexi bacterium]|nr:hypothetical protein [Chloroflexota bacterium]
MFNAPLRRLANAIYRTVDNTTGGAFFKRQDLINGLLQTQQIQLRQHYQALLNTNPALLPALHETEFRIYSQHGEDGIIHYIFSIIGATTKRCVEICAGDGIQCNSANLIIHHGWDGLLFDGDAKNVERGRRFYQVTPDTISYPPVFELAWITRDNINDLIRRAGFAGEVDLLTIDIDG